MKIKALIITVLLAVTAGAAPAQTVELTGMAWEVTGFDQISWNGSDLFFTSQIPTASGYNLVGYFDWYSNGQFRGRELFRGTLTSTRHLQIEGYQLINPINIQRARYNADVAPNGARIINGTWIGLESPISGVWSATAIACVATGEISRIFVNPGTVTSSFDVRTSTPGSTSMRFTTIDKKVLTVALSAQARHERVQVTSTSTDCGVVSGGVRLGGTAAIIATAP